MPYIYVITCTITGEQYIGSCLDPKTRWKTHVAGMRRGYAPKLLRECAAKHGYKNFTFDVLCECDEYQEVERQVLRQLNPALNIHHTSKSVHEMTRRRVAAEGRKRKRYLVGDEQLTMIEVAERYGQMVVARVRSGLRGADAIRPKNQHRQHI